MNDFFTPTNYLVEKIEGDYAWLSRADGTGDAMPVARALLPAEIDEGSRLLWQDLQYTLEA